MTKASDNAFPSILITEGTEPSAPAAGKQRLYIDSTTHLLKATNSSGTDRTIEGVAAGAITSSGLTMATARLLGRTTASTGAIEEITVGSGLSLSAGSLTATGGSGGLVHSAATRVTSGDITLNNTTLSAVTGPIDVTSVGVTAGDIIMVGMTSRPGNTTAQSVAFDFATIVSASPVNYVSVASGTPNNIPVPWFCGSGEQSSVSGSVPYVAQSGDISGGDIVFRLYFRTSGSRVWGASTTHPLLIWATNLGQ